MKIRIALFTAALLSVAPSYSYAECKDNLVSSTPAVRFVHQDQGTVVDTASGLVWMRCAQGFDWDGTTCLATEDSKEFTWTEALQLAENYQFAGETDWRLPNKNELASIVERRCFAPAIEATVFPNTPVNSFWSNTPNYFNVSFAWAVNFDLGEHTTTRRSNLLAVRLVRDFSPID